MYLQGSKVDDAVDFWVFGKDFHEFCFVCDVDLVEGWPLSTQKLNAIKGNDRGIVEAVDDDHLIVILEEGESCEGSNVSHTTV